MKDFQDLPDSKLTYGLYLVRNTQVINLEWVKKLHNFATKFNSLISLERLCKGDQSVLAIYGPSALISSFDELQLLELENYLKDEGKDSKRIGVDQSYTWLLGLKKGDSLKSDRDLFYNLELSNDQYFFWQVVCFPVRESFFQVTIRAMVVDPAPNNRVELAKKIDKKIDDHLGLTKKREYPKTVFTDFNHRSLIPKEVTTFKLNGEKLLNLLGVN